MAYSTALALIDSFPVFNPKRSRSRLSAVSTLVTKASMSTKCQAFTISEILGLENRAESTQRTNRGSLDSFSPSSISSTDESSPSSYWADQSDESDPTEAEVEPTTTTKRKRNRASFSSYQIREMRRAFAASTYLSFAMEDELIQRLGLTGKQIRTWFQNQRGKQRRERNRLNQLSRPMQSDEQTTQQPPATMTTLNRLNQSDRIVPHHQFSRPYLTPNSYDLEGSWDQPTDSFADSSHRRLLYRDQSSPRLYHGCCGYHPYRRPVNLPGPARTHYKDSV